MKGFILAVAIGVSVTLLVDWFTTKHNQESEADYSEVYPYEVPYALH